MHEQQIPKEAVTGLLDIPCLVFGNGVEIELKEAYTTRGTQSFQTKSGETVHRLPRGKGVGNESVVKIHFLPKTDQWERAHDPALVSQEEKKKIAVDALDGFLLLADALQKDAVQIPDLSSRDFYLLAETNPRFAAFLRQRCGFTGDPEGTDVWIKKSDFISESNVEHMRQQKTFITGLPTAPPAQTPGAVPVNL